MYRCCIRHAANEMAQLIQYARVLTLRLSSAETHLSPIETAQQARSAKEPTASDEANHGQGGCSPEQGPEKIRRPGCRAILQAVVSNIPKGSQRTEHHTENPNDVKSLLVIPTASKAFEKIHAVTNLVLKLLYESSNVFFSTITGGWYSAKARLTVISNWLSISA